MYSTAAFFSSGSQNSAAARRRGPPARDVREASLHQRLSNLSRPAGTRIPLGVARAARSQPRESAFDGGGAWVLEHHQVGWPAVTRMDSHLFGNGLHSRAEGRSSPADTQARAGLAEQEAPVGAPKEQVALSFGESNSNGGRGRASHGHGRLRASSSS